MQSLEFDVEQAASAAEALSIIPGFDLDIALIDLDLGEGPSGLDTLAYIREEAPWAAAIILTSHRSISLATPQAPPQGTDLVHLVKSDINSVSVLGDAVNAALARVPYSAQSLGSARVISGRQAEVIRLVAAGCSNEEIARQMDLTTRSVERRISRLYRSLGVDADPKVNSRVEAARLYATGKVVIR
jgi:DNA-binding NarL/FixJ family response regulator